jgi:hypothetical protein
VSLFEHQATNGESRGRWDRVARQRVGSLGSRGTGCRRHQFFVAAFGAPDSFGTVCAEHVGNLLTSEIKRLPEQLRWNSRAGLDAKFAVCEKLAWRR